MGKKLGFALGAGGSRGVAHIGFLQAMEENGIVPDVISGSSMGAVVGSCYAAGMSVEEMKQNVFALKKNDLFDLSVNPLKNAAIFKSEKMHNKLKELLGDKTFAELKIPFSCAAVDLRTGEEVTLDGGRKVCECVAASSSIPLVFKPMAIDKMLLVDGGLKDRVPVRLAREAGAEVVVAVDVLGDVEEAKEAYSLTSVIFRTLELYDIAASEMNMWHNPPDLMIKPAMKGLSQYKFGKFAEAYEAGYKAGKENAEAIRQLIAEGKPPKKRRTAAEAAGSAAKPAKAKRR